MGVISRYALPTSQTASTPGGSCFPKSLAEVYSNTFANGLSQYAFGPGFINFNGGDFPDKTTFGALITAPATRGDKLLYVNSTDGIWPGTVRPAAAT